MAVTIEPMPGFVLVRPLQMPADAKISLSLASSPALARVLAVGSGVTVVAANDLILYREVGASANLEVDPQVRMVVAVDDILARVIVS